jgi:hypothetical protein
VIVTGASNESSVVVSSISAVTSNDTAAALRRDPGMPSERSTGEESCARIWITTEEEVAVKFAGVSTVRDRPLCESVVLAGAFTSTEVVVAITGAEEPGHPIVVKESAVDVA